MVVTATALVAVLATARCSLLDALRPGQPPTGYRADLVQVRRGGDVVRAVVGALAPADGPGGACSPMSRAEEGADAYETGWRVHGPEAATVAEPLRTEQGCLCTRSVITTGSSTETPFWTDFPAPTSECSAPLLEGRFPRWAPSRCPVVRPRCSPRATCCPAPPTCPRPRRAEAPWQRWCAR